MNNKKCELEDDVDDEDIDDDVETERPKSTKIFPKHKRKSEEPEGLAECYWCGGFFDKATMKRIDLAGLVNYKCERC
mgnify:CR=1 FL=1